MVTTHLTLDELRSASGGAWTTAPPLCLAQQATVSRVVINSRDVQRGDVFWALSGNRHDGADFADDAYHRGASGVVLQPKRLAIARGRWALQVDDSLAALRRTAAWQRDRFQGHVIAVSGSVGKTTCREMIDCALKSRLHGITSPQNYNNHVGLPLSMLAMSPEDQYAVLELGASSPGEIGNLARLFRPRIGVITSVGEAHLSGFGSQRNIARAKTELLTALPRDGVAILNGDDPLLRRMAAGYPGETIFFGRDSDCDLTATGVQFGNGQLRFRIQEQAFNVPVWGRHHLGNALAAVAVGHVLGISTRELSAGLARFKTPPMRCQIKRCRDICIIDDSYNASPRSVRAAFGLLREMQTTGKRIIVCGDMLELGRESTKWHQKTGQEVVSISGADVLIACGAFATQMVDSARGAGMPDAKTYACHDLQEVMAALQAVLSPGDVVLIKGSRGTHMEEVVHELESGYSGRLAA
jgi:UDP-N-acetylmuramoyl-tripeptide--D-alanyl-D-alanine ligase